MTRIALRPIKPIRERNPIAVAVAGLVILAAIALLVYFSGDLPIIGGGTGYTAYFAEAAGLQPGNEVRIAGVTVGSVTGVSLDGAKVAVTFDVKNAPLRGEASAPITLGASSSRRYAAMALPA